MQLETIESALNMKLSSYQKDFILAEEKSMCLLWGRKAGKSTSIEAREAWNLLTKRMPGLAYNGGIGILTVGEREGREMVRGIVSILQFCGWTTCEYREDRDEASKTFYSSANEIWMPDGNRLLALPCGQTGKNVRPYSFHELVYDEADFINPMVFESTSACLARYDGTRIFASTINPLADKTTPFARAFFDKQLGFRTWDIPTTKAAFITKKFLYEEMRRMGKDAFGREYLNKWRSSRNAIFREILTAVRSKEPLKFDDEMEQADEVFIGVDFARFGHDSNVIAFCFLKGEKCKIMIEVIRGKMRTTPVTGRILWLCSQYPKISKVVTDVGGVGAGPTDALVEQLGIWKVIEISNQSRVAPSGGQEGRRRIFQKVDMYTNALRLMEWGKVILDDDIEIVKSLMSMTWSYTEYGDLTIYGTNNHASEAIVRAMFPMYSGGPRWKGDIDIVFIPSE